MRRMNIMSNFSSFNDQMIINISYNNSQMKNQKQTHLTNKVLNSPLTKTKPKNKIQVSLSKVPLFEVKQLQIESKHDLEENQSNTKNIALNVRMCESITPQNKPQQMNIHQEREQSIDKVKSSFIKQQSQNLFDRAATIRNLAKENQMIEDQRSLHILLNKQYSNLNYLSMQIRELLKLTHITILFEEEKDLRNKISVLEIACRKLKIGIRNAHTGSKSPRHRLRKEKSVKDREARISKEIREEKTKNQQLDTKLLLLQNYFMRKTQENKICLTEYQTQNNNTQNQLYRKKHHNSLNSAKHHEILKDRIHVMRESIALTQKYTSDKIKRLQKENQILKQELVLIKYDIKNGQSRLGVKRNEVKTKIRSLKLISHRNSPSAGSSLKKCKRNLSKNSCNSYYRQKNESKSKSWVKKNLNRIYDYTSSPGDKKEDEEEGYRENQTLRKMQYYIAGEYFQKRSDSLQP